MLVEGRDLIKNTDDILQPARLDVGAVTEFDDQPHLLPPTDRGVSALVDDLDGRGLLDETLVVMFGEFGRTPKVNSAGGRDHWPMGFSVALAGGGVRGGTEVGATDPDGNKWEVYVVLDDAAQHPSTESACCADKSDCCEDRAACCTAPPVSEGTMKTNDRSSACACSV